MSRPRQPGRATTTGAGARPGRLAPPAAPASGKAAAPGALVPGKAPTVAGHAGKVAAPAPALPGKAAPVAAPAGKAASVAASPAPSAPEKPAGAPPSPAAQQRLVQDHIPFVRSIARRLREQMPGIEMDDLVGFGMQGLLEAAQRYDKRHGVVFTTFAYYRVRGAMFDGIRTMGWLPRSEYARLRFEERASAYLENLSARSDGEEGGAVEEEVQRLATALSGVATVFVTLLSSMDESTLLDDRPAAHEQLEQHQLGQRVRRAMGRLPEKERRLIEAYYFGDQTLEQVGAGMGLSKSWTSRLHARAVALLREGLLAEGFSE